MRNVCAVFIIVLLSLLVGCSGGADQFGLKTTSAPTDLIVSGSVNWACAHLQTDLRIDVYDIDANEYWTTFYASPTPGEYSETVTFMEGGNYRFRPIPPSGHYVTPGGGYSEYDVGGSLNLGGHDYGVDDI